MFYRKVLADIRRFETISAELKASMETWEKVDPDVASTLAKDIVDFDDNIIMLKDKFAGVVCFHICCLLYIMLIIQDLFHKLN